MPPAARGRSGRYKRTRRKPCAFCVEHADHIDYKSFQKLRKFTSDRGKILPRKTSGTCATHQRMLAHAVKRAREIALMPFVTD